MGKSVLEVSKDSFNRCPMLSGGVVHELTHLVDREGKFRAG